MVKAVYPGTFDPPTNGHVDIVARSSRLFEHLTVAVYDMPPKSLLFSAEERCALFQQSVQYMANVEVVSFHGLIVEFVRSRGATLVVRGLRAGSDFESEFEMAMMNKNLAPGIDAVYMMTSLEWQFLSSTRVKEVAELGGDVSGLVPPLVAAALQAKLQGAA